MPWASSSIAAVTTSSTERLWPRWMTSAPCACSTRRITLIAASWPSNSAAAVTKRSRFLGAGGSGGFGGVCFAFGLSATGASSGNSHLRATGMARPRAKRGRAPLAGIYVIRRRRATVGWRRDRRRERARSVRDVYVNVN